MWLTSTLPAELGKVEDDIFKNRREKDLDFKRRNKEKKRRMNVSEVAESLTEVIPPRASVCVFCRVITRATRPEDNLLQR